MLTSVPAAAASAPPDANAIADIAARVDADQPAPTGSIASARIAAPKRVRLRISQIARPHAQATPKASTRLAAKVKPMICTGSPR